MPASVNSLVLDGFSTRVVNVETDIGRGLPFFSIVGLATKEIQEAKDRLKSAIRNSQLPFPRHRLTINLIPADLSKKGTYLDLAMAVSILAAQGVVPVEKNQLFIGELGLNGSLHRVKALPALLAQLKNISQRKIYIPYANKEDVTSYVAREATIYLVKNLTELTEILTNKITPEISLGIRPVVTTNQEIIDYSLIDGQAQAKRCLEIAAAGGHSLLLQGPPGIGKTSLARALISILPELDEKAVTYLSSLQTCYDQYSGLSASPPFRAPDLTTTVVNLKKELVLAYKGVLFLDELIDFSPLVLKSLRTPLNDQTVTLGYKKQEFSLPVQSIIVGAYNPCPCGYFNDSANVCTCTQAQLRHYKQKLSNTLLDRIDMHLFVSRQNQSTQKNIGETSDIIRSRVIAARERQSKKLNSQLSHEELKNTCQLTDEAQKLIATFESRYHFSIRGLDKVLRVARTIADLASSDLITEAYLAEAIQYNARD